MKVNCTNEQALDAAIHKAEGKSSARTLEVSRVQRAVEKAEEMLQAMGIPKKFWQGSHISINPPNVPNKYFGIAYGTAATIERGPRDWFLVSCRRFQCGNQSYGGAWRHFLRLSTFAVEHIRKNPIEL